MSKAFTIEVGTDRVYDVMVGAGFRTDLPVRWFKPTFGANELADAQRKVTPLLIVLGEGVQCSVAVTEVLPVDNGMDPHYNQYVEGDLQAESDQFGGEVRVYLMGSPYDLLYETGYIQTDQSSPSV